MTRYHSDEYIRFLKNIRPDNVHEYTKLMQRCECVWLETASNTTIEPTFEHTSLCII